MTIVRSVGSTFIRLINQTHQADYTEVMRSNDRLIHILLSGRSSDNGEAVMAIDCGYVLGKWFVRI